MVKGFSVLFVSSKVMVSKKWINIVTKINRTAIAPIYTRIKIKPIKSLALMSNHRLTPKRKKIKDKILAIRLGIKANNNANEKHKKSI